jgi:hypothetical protein
VEGVGHGAVVDSLVVARVGAVREDDRVDVADGVGQRFGPGEVADDEVRADGQHPLCAVGVTDEGSRGEPCLLGRGDGRSADAAGRANDEDTGNGHDSFRFVMPASTVFAVAVRMSTSVVAAPFAVSSGACSGGDPDSVPYTRGVRTLVLQDAPSPVLRFRA